MDSATPFVGLFRDIYPQRRSVDLAKEPHLVGVLIKSVYFHRQDETLLCRGLVLQGQHVAIYTTVNLRITGIAPIVGYDLDLQDEDETWDAVKYKWSRHFAAEPAYTDVLHEDIKRKTNAVVFPVKSISSATSYIKTVKGALTFGDFCPDRGFYLSRDGNTPALCSDVMFGRMYFVPAHKLSRTDMCPSDLIYDHQKSELEAKVFDSKHEPFMYKAACLDIETVFDESHRDLSLRCDTFAYRFPYCTERLVADVLGYREKLVASLNTQRKELLKHSRHVSIPTLSPDMPGQQHEITCVSLVILNTHAHKPAKGHHRKKLIVLYNKNKVKEGRNPEQDCQLAKDAGIDDVKRIMFYPCSGELALLERLIALLYKYEIELLYVYNAEFDVRVLEQRVHFYTQSNYSRRSVPDTQRRCSRLLKAWHGLFINKELSGDGVPFFQFESVRYLDMYKDMIQNVGAVLSKGPLTEYKLHQVALHVDKFNKEKAKLGHFKMNSCGMNIIDLYRMAGTRDIKYACTSMKLNDVAPYVISKVRELHKKPQKDMRKLCKLADVSYEKMDDMINSGGKGLFAVLVYNLVDSQLCSRLAKVLNPVSALFHRCRTTLNIDVIVHGRGDNFGGFVQSIHSVQIPELKYTLDTLRVKSGPLGAQLETRKRWDPKLEPGDGETWKGGAVCDPLTGLHYSGPSMGLELSFDFSSMYPSIMCALNISPETTVPWPPKDFPHDLSGWVCYSWEAEGFKYASLVLKYDNAKRQFAQAPGVFASSVAYYLNQRADYKRKLQNPDIADSDRVYYKLQEGECKVLANSFYGTAPHPCGPLISGHGRQQISVVNNCVSRFYQHKCPVVYGDTDSVMVAVGYGPDDIAEADLSDAKVGTGSLDAEAERGELHQFAHQGRIAMGDKFKRAGERVPEFLDYVHAALVEDVLRRMYVIGPCNEHQRVIRDPNGSVTKQGYPVYLAKVPGEAELLDVTEAFVKDRRVKLEYENSCSVYCHVAKKTYVALTHTVDDTNEISSISVKVRGLAAFKSMRSPCDSAVTETFISCVMRGDCVKLQTNQAACFTTCPWHQLQRGDDILYFKQEPTFDASGRWLELNQASSFLTAYKVSDVITLVMDGGFSAVSVRLVPLQTGDGTSLVVRTLHKYGKYCMNHMFSRKQGVLRDLLVNRACEIIASKMGAGFFPWSSLIKSAKNKHFSPQTLERLKVSKSSVKTTYMEIVKTWLQRITGLSVKPVECYEFYKCNPCEASFYRYPLNLQAASGCLTVMFGGSLLCETKKPRLSGENLDRSDLSDRETRSSNDSIINHPYQPGNLCYANSRVLTSHRVDRSLVNRSGKLLAHCIIDFCVPRHMYGCATGTSSIRDCEHWLLIAIVAIRDRLKRATTMFNSVMNICPEHMIPICDTSEMDLIASNRETVRRIACEKLETCNRVITSDMNLRPNDTYKTLGCLLKEKLTALMSQKLVSLDRDLISNSGCISMSVPNDMLKEAGFDSPNGRLSIVRSDLHEKTLVDLAGLMYQTVLMLQTHKPDAFAYSAALYPKHVLCIMPYSCADQTNMTRWMSSFKEKKWLKDVQPKLGKRTLRAATECKEVTYHCTGCKNFYRDLFANKVPVDRVISCIYDQDKKRRLGYCVNEKHWLF